MKIVLSRLLAMLKRPYSALRWRLLLLMVLTLVPLVFYEIAIAIHVRQEAEQQAWSMLTRSLASASQPRAIVPMTQRLIIGLARGARVKNAVLGQDPSTCVRLLVNFGQAYPEVAQLGVVDAAGQITCSSLGEGVVGDVGQEGWFTALRGGDGRANGFLTTDSASGESILVLATPLETASGPFSGVVFAAVKVSSIRQAIVHESLPRSAVLYLRDAAGTVDGGRIVALDPVAVTLPQSGASVSKPDRGSFIEALQTESAARLRIRQDGVTFMVVSTTLFPGGIRGFLGVPREDAVLVDRRYITAFIAGPLAMLAIALLVAAIGSEMMISRRVRALSDVAEAYGRGDYSKRPDTTGGVREIRQLAETLSEVAARISARERDLYRALAERELLLKEVHHRVKNNLQIVSSFLSLQSKGIEESTAKVVLQNARARVGALALVHRHLYEGNQETSVALHDFTRALVRQVCDSFAARPPAYEVDVDAAEGVVSIDHAVPLALFLTEALANAIRHARSGDEPCRIHVRLATAPEGALELSVSDSGPGLPCRAQRDGNGAGRGIGLSLMEGFARQLGGEMRVEGPPGVRVTLTIPPMPAPAPESDPLGSASAPGP